MVTKVRKATAFNPVEIFVQQLSIKKDAEALTKRSEALKKRLKEWLPKALNDDHVYQNEQGSIFYDLDETVNVAGTDYKGMELRRAVSNLFDEDEATKILKRKGVYEEALEPVLSQDKIYRLVQEGKITEADLDKMFEEKESFAFWPVKG